MIRERKVSKEKNGSLMIRTANYSDAWAIAEIYNYYVINTAITFELECVTAYRIAQQIEQCQAVGAYLVYEESRTVAGYACVSGVRQRMTDHHSVESVIFLKNGFRGKGIGFRLYSDLLSNAVCRDQVIIAGIARSNRAGIRLHEKCGFRKVPHFSKTARKFGEWIDLDVWQKI
jgi:phosphinothricin acetyltransferase